LKEATSGHKIGVRKSIATVIIKALILAGFVDFGSRGESIANRAVTVVRSSSGRIETEFTARVIDAMKSSF